MTSRRLLWSALGAVAILLMIGGGWLWSLPPAPSVTAPPPIAQAERDATVAALKPPKRQRPLIAIIGINDGTETTDYLMPYGILRRADVADVITLATKPGPVQLYPVLKVEPQATIAEFDAQHPDGADYVIVPAMIRDDDPAALQWIRNQSARGAIIVGVCVGAKVVGEAGLLHNKRATTHWYSVKELRSKHPTMQYVKDRRFVVDDQDGDGLVGHAASSVRGVPSAGKSAGTGMRMVKIAPARSVRLAAAIVPPIASMKPRLIDRPRPVPARTWSRLRTR